MHFSRHLQEGLFSRPLATSSVVVRSVFDHGRTRLSLRTVPVSHLAWLMLTFSHSPFQPVRMKKLSLRKMKTRVWVTGHSLFRRLPLCQSGTISCSHPTLQFSLSSKLLRPFSLLLPTLSYSNRPFTGIGCCRLLDCFHSVKNKNKKLSFFLWLFSFSKKKKKKKSFFLDTMRP